VLESTRAKEAQLKKETSEQLDLFRQQQADVEKAMLANDVTGGASGSPTGDVEESWATNPRKRKKKAKDSEVLKGVKLRRTSSTSEPQKPPTITMNPVDPSQKDSTPIGSDATAPDKSTSTDRSKNSIPTSHEGIDATPAILSASSPKAKPAVSLGLVAYGSDSDSD
jgi:hypothetical protein